jgi:O-antigen ligase
MSFAVLPIWLFLGSLLVAPQLWWSPLLGLRVDYIVYPMWILVLASRGRLGEVFRFRTQDYFFLLMYVWIFLSVMVAGLTDIGQFYLVYYAKLFLVYRLVSATISDVTDLKRTGYALIALALLIAIEGIQHMNNPEGIGWAGQSYAWIDGSASSIGLKSRIRWIGIFDGPGVFCVMFTAAAPFAFQYMVSPYALWLRAVAAVGLTFPLLLAAFYTGSRGGILATAAMVGMFIVSRFRISLGKLVLAAACGGIALAAAPSYLTETKDANNSAQGRVEMWAMGLQMVQESPLFGVGKGNFAVYTRKLVAHNSALEAMGETGFPGMFLWIAIIYMGFKHIIVRLRETVDPTEKQALLAVMMSLSGYLISSLFVSLETEIMYFLLGMTAAVGRFTTQPVGFTRKDFMFIVAFQVAYYMAFKVFIMGYY